MPRESSLTVKKRPDLRDQYYHVLVERVEKVISPPGLRVQLRHVDGEHKGRLHEVLLEEPLYPDSILGEFFTAAKQTVTLSKKVYPQHCVGLVISVRFRMSDNEYVPVSFSSSTEQLNNEASSQET